MKKRRACEVGNFDTKLIGEQYIKAIDKKDKDKTESEKPITILNMVSGAKDRRSFGNKKKNSLVNLLDVTITTPREPAANGRFFVGGLAFTEGGSTILKPTSDDKKSENPLTIIEMLTALGLASYFEDTSNPKRTEVIDLSTCLPTEEYYDTEKDYVELLSNKLKGIHVVKFNDDAFNGAEITIDIESVLINPEGATAQMASTYDWNGEVLPEMEGHEYKTILNIDIGSIDVNISILRNGEFIELFGIKGGTTKVLRKIGTDIKHDYNLDYNIDPHKVDYHIRNDVPFYVGDELVNDLKDRAKRAYALESLYLANNVTMELKDRGIEKSGINMCNMTGGGTQWMKADFWDKFKSQHMTIKSPPRPRFANVEGAYKALVMEDLESEEANEEVFSQA